MATPTSGGRAGFITVVSFLLPYPNQWLTDDSLMMRVLQRIAYDTSVDHIEIVMQPNDLCNMVHFVDDPVLIGLLISDYGKFNFK